MKPLIKRTLIGFSTIITIILIAIVLLFININSIIDYLKAISIFGLVLFFLIYTGVFIMRTIRLKIIFQGLNLETSFYNLYGSYGIGWIVNELIPFKFGDLVRMEVIRQKEKHATLSKSLSGVGIERVLDLLILFSVTCISLFIMYFLGIQGTSKLNLDLIIFIFAIILLGGAIFLIFLFLRTDWILNIIGKISPRLSTLLEGFLRNFIKGINEFRQNKRKMIEIVLLSLPTWFFETFTLIIIFYSNGYAINVIIIIIAQIILFFSKTLPITPGGWLVSEPLATTFIFLFYPSILYETIFGLVILDHGLRLIYILIYGIISSLLLNFKYRSINLSQYKTKRDKKRREESVTRGFGLLEKFFSIQRMKIAQKLIKKHDKKGTILDIGCGMYPFFLMNADFEEKFGIDQEIEDRKIKTHNLILKNHNVCEDLDLPFENDSFDVITMLAVLEHLEKDQVSRILTKCYDLLKKDGILIITTPAHWSDLLLKIMAKVHLVSPEEIEEHKQAFRMVELNDLINYSNFKQESVQKGYFEIFLNMWMCAKK
ncbi:MAG: flippase-like domain-containing protein [Promethearchaeota archaeon]